MHVTTRPPLVRRAAGALAALLLAAVAALLHPAAAHADTQICDQFGSTSIAGGRYVVQNNEWGDTSPQCINVTASGFAVTTASHNLPTNGAPAAYPSIYAGCHYGNCTTGSGLPLQVSAFGNPESTVAFHTSGGSWDAAYDIWFDSSPTPTGQNNGAELMIWGSHAGAPQPAGSKVGTANLEGAAWDVWEGRLSNGGISWNVISYVRQQTTGSLDVHVKDFTDDITGRGYMSSAWYMTSVQFGFEPWVGGTGLGVDNFTFTTNGTSGGGGGGTGGSTVVGQGSGRCVDVDAAGTADGTVVQLWDCNGTVAQKWNRVGNTFVNPNSGKCLDVSGGGTANGTVVQLWTCLNNAAQQWVVNGNGTIVNPNSGRCLDAAGQGTANGTRLQIWDCYGGGTQPNQVWSLR